MKTTAQKGKAEAAAGLAVPVGPESSLDDWHASQRQPIEDSVNALERYLLVAIREGRWVEFVYDGASEFRAARRVRPEALFRVARCPSAYLTGFCESRQGARTFRLDRIRIAGVSPETPLARADQPTSASRPKFVYRTLRERWQDELKMPIPLLQWSEAEAFLHRHCESLMWVLADWDEPAPFHLAIVSEMGSGCLDGLPFAALDFREAIRPHHPFLDQLALKTSNWFIRFSDGREIWRKTGLHDEPEFQEWLEALRKT